MRSVHRSDCDEVCNGDWCRCPCHLDRQELERQRAAIKAEAAKLHELSERLEGAREGGEAMDEPTDLDLVTDHPFKQAHGFGLDDMCGHRYEDGWLCGYGDGEHAERLEGAAAGGEAIETP